MTKHIIHRPLFLIAVGFLIIITAGQAAPLAKETPPDTTRVADALPPEDTCARLALKEHALVMTDPVNRLDHAALAAAYEAFAQHHLKCT